MNQKLVKVLDYFKDKKILVIGDIMLDKYLHGTVERISPEAPIQVVKHKGCKFVPGGAANTACNIASLGAKTIICGVIGHDEDGKNIIGELESRNVKTLGIIKSDSRPTCVKQRIVADNHQLLRVDYEASSELSLEDHSGLLEFVKKVMFETDLIVISDYAKGTLSERFMEQVKLAAKEYGVKIIVDTKPKNMHFYSNVDLMTPNLKEATEMAGVGNGVNDIGVAIRDRLNSSVFLTRGSEGISVFSLGGAITHHATEKVKIFDVSGAGDTVVAVAALGLTCGMSLEEIAELSNAAGRIVVQKQGTSVIKPEELRNELSMGISEFIREGIEVKQEMIETQLEDIHEFALKIVECYNKDRKVLAFGNGGSATDAQHLVGELVGRFKKERRGLSASALASDVAVVTAIANDYGYDRIFERQVEALTRSGDVLIGISTSGNSKNVNLALKKAKQMGAFVIGMSGRGGGEMADLCDLMLKVPSDNTPRIQEAHMAIIHIVCEMIEKEMFD